MSKGSDRDQKPAIHGRDLTTDWFERPKRTTRREVDYRNSGEGGSNGSQRQDTEGVVPREVFRQGALREVRDSSIDSVWGGSTSDSTDTVECWSPRTVERRTGILFDGVNQLRSQLKQIQMAKKEEMSVQDLLKMMLEMNNRQEEERQKREVRLAEETRAREAREKDERLQRERRMEEDSRIRMEKMVEEAKIREEEREERARIREEKRMQDAKEREEERRIQAEEREHKMVVALRETRPLVENVKLPTMEKGMEIESFLELFETALTVAKIPEDKWITRLHAALDSDTKLLAREIFVNPDSTFEEAKAALTGQNHMSFSAASEAMMLLDEEKVTRMTIRQGAQRVASFLKKACEQAPTWGETHLYGAVAIMRYHMHQEVKTYLDLKGIEKPDDCF